MEIKSAHTQSEMLATAATIGGEKGVDEITFRQVAEACNISPSLIVYHFHNRENFLINIFCYIHNKILNKINSEILKVKYLPIEVRSAPSFFTNLIVNLTEVERREVILLLEVGLFLSNCRKSLPHQSNFEILNVISEVFQIEYDDSKCYLFLFNMMLWVSTVKSDQIMRHLWAQSVFNRLKVRLSHRNEVIKLHSLKSDFDLGRKSRNEEDLIIDSRSVSIFNSVIKLISLGQKLTHRSIASNAEIPLSTMYKLYPDKETLIKYSYEYYYKTLSERSKDNNDQDYLNPFSEDGSLRPSSMAMGSMQLFLARNDLVDIQSIINSRGKRSLEILQKHNKNTDIIDGMILSLSQGPISPDILFSDFSARYEIMENTIKGILVNLFNVKIHDVTPRCRVS